MLNSQPTSFVDGLARQHDIDYLKYNSSSLGALYSDLKAITGTYSDISLQSLAMRTGLTARSVLNVLSLGLLGNFNNNIPGLTSQQSSNVGYQLQSVVDGFSN